LFGGKNMTHPYRHLEGTPAWQAVEKAIADLEENSDIGLFTGREYIIGYILSKLNGRATEPADALDPPSADE